MNLSFHNPLLLKIWAHHKTNAISETSGYSIAQARIDLKRFLGINLEWGLTISVLFHLALIGSYYGFQYFDSMNDDGPVLRIRIMKYNELGPPPSITNSMTAPSVSVSKFTKPTVGIPVPVPDAEINPEQTIATQTEMSAVTNEALSDGEGTGGQLRIEEDVKIDNDEPGMNDFIPVEKNPQIVHSEQPQYPDLARRANMEGFVWVKILVDKDGKPRKAVVIKESGGALFNEAAISAAMKYQFTPAVMNSGPVQVWVALKFNFQLVGKK